jgi:hypothetical protein
MNTAMEMMNNAIIALNFFEPVNRFEDHPAAYQQGYEKDYCVHFTIYI